MNFLKNIKTDLITLASTNDANKYVVIIENVIRWVANALAGIGATLVIIQIVKAGISLSQADSPEAASKAKKHLFYSILGLILILSATTAVNIVCNFIPQWLQNNIPQS